jgi:hypothetical protein
MAEDKDQLAWCEPNAGMDETSQEVIVNVEMRVSRKGAEQIARYVGSQLSSQPAVPLSPKAFVDEFLVVNWATFVDGPPPDLEADRLAKYVLQVLDRLATIEDGHVHLCRTAKRCVEILRVQEDDRGLDEIEDLAREAHDAVLRRNA